MIVSNMLFDRSLSISGGESRMIDIRILSCRVISLDDYILDITNMNL